MTVGEIATTADVARVEARLDRLLALVEKLTPAQWISVAEAAEALGVIPSTVRAMCARGEVIWRRAGRRVLVDVGSLRAPDPAQEARR